MTGVIIAKTAVRSLRPFLLPLLLAGILPASGGCVPKTPEPEWPEDNVLVLTLNNAPTNLDPRLGTDASSQRIFELILNGLVGKDPQGNLTPALAESWEILDGGRRYRFHLRPGVTFHDGRTMTARDVKWTYGTIVDGTVATPKSAAYDRVTEIEVVDPMTVDFHLTEPFGSFLVEFTSAQGVIPAGTTPEQMNEHPIGTGPFRFARMTPETVTLERFPECWEGVPYVERVVLREIPDATVRVLELMKGTAQLLINDVPPDMIPRFREHPSYAVVEDPGAVYSYIGFNLRDPLLDDVRVRRALAHAIDRQKLVDTLWRGLGVVSETMLPPGLYYRHEDLPLYEYDQQLAGRLLDEAGYPDPPGDAPRFELSYKTSTNEPYVLQAQIIQQMLAEVGIEVEISSQEFATFYEDIRRGNFQLFSLLRFGVTDPLDWNLDILRQVCQAVRFVVFRHLGAMLIDHGRVVIIHGGGGASLVHDLPHPGAALRIPLRHGLPIDVRVGSRLAIGLVLLVEALELGIVGRPGRKGSDKQERHDGRRDDRSLLHRLPHGLRTDRCEG